MTTREYILDEARKCVMRDRNLDYDEPEKNFERIAAFWNTYLGDKLAMPITPHDTAVMAILIKISRIMQSPGKADHWTDIAGYAACGAEATGIKEPDSGSPYWVSGGASLIFDYGHMWPPQPVRKYVPCKCDQACDCGSREDWAEFVGDMGDVDDE